MNIEIKYYLKPLCCESDKEQARDEVNKIINEDFVGTFTVEFFIDKSNNLYVNEIAPRPQFRTLFN